MFAGRTTAELTPSMRLYSFAVLLHEESLRQRQRELEQGRATTPPLDPPRTTESDR
jgi:hypothetical protein